MEAAALGLGWHHGWHFWVAVGWYGWAGQPMAEKGWEGEAA